MSMVLAKRLREQRATLANTAKELLDRAETENRELTADETQSFDAAHAKIEELRAQIERIEKHEALEKELTESRGTQAAREDRKGGEHSASDETRAKAEQEQRLNRVFDKYLRHGEQELNVEERGILMERRAQSTGTNSAGGYTIAPAFYDQLETALKAFGGMRAVSTVIATDTGATLPMPTANDTTQVGAILAENATVTEQDITFGVVNVGAYMYSSKSILVSYQLLQDSAFDISAYIAEQLATRIGRAQNAHFTVGTGSSQPNGVVTAASVGVTGATGETTSVIYDDLVGLVHSVDPAYRQGARFMLADSTLLAIKKLKDSQGHPLWQPSLIAGTPDSLLGFGVTVNQDVAPMTANAKSILFGDFSKYFIRDVKGVSVMRLNERYADAGQVGFIGWARADGNLLDAGTKPVKYFANSAT